MLVCNGCYNCLVLFWVWWIVSRVVDLCSLDLVLNVGGFGGLIGMMLCCLNCVGSVVLGVSFWCC